MPIEEKCGVCGEIKLLETSKLIINRIGNNTKSDFEFYSQFICTECNSDLVRKVDKFVVDVLLCQ